MDKNHSEQERWASVFKLKQQGFSNKKIAEMIGVSADRIRHLITKYHTNIRHENGWCAGLTKNTAFLLERNGYTSKQAVSDSFDNGKLMLIARFGPAKRNEVAKWLSKPEMEIFKAPPDYTVETATKFLISKGYEVVKKNANA